ncbi:MAG: imelysin family protein [Chitinophagaceae bacterium]|nr:imelysin family protein [Chitinophagaceae bacterium]
MKKHIFLPLVSALIILSTIIACNKTDGNKKADPTNNLDRGPILANYADNYILPAYDAMVFTLTHLQQEMIAFTSNPTEGTLNAAQFAYEDAYHTWQRVDLINFGPASDKSLRSFVNIYPVTVSKLNNNISSGTYNLEEFGNKDAQGLPALDYLLFGIASDKPAILAMYTTDAQASARKKYLNDVVAKMLEKVTAVRDEWSVYKNTFVNSTGTDAGSSLSLMVNGIVMYYERYLRSAKIGLPVGAMTSVIKPELSEAYYHPTLSGQLAAEANKAFRAFYFGNHYGSTLVGESMYTYLGAIGTQDGNGALMADVVLSELDDVSYKLSNIATTVQGDVVNNKIHILETYEQMQEVVPLLKVDMVSAFSISITYTDNDGD